jgi:uncharacterized protein YbdZ (MbtH family)
MFDDDRHYDVVRNDEDQYSIWPTGLTIPAGWQAVGTSGLPRVHQGRLDRHAPPQPS